jgi:hypothetical protein
MRFLSATVLTVISSFVRRWLRECNASEVGAEELQKKRGVRERAEFTSHNRTRGCGEFLTMAVVAS